jgi:hypothetical protein
MCNKKNASKDAGATAISPSSRDNVSAKQIAEKQTKSFLQGLKPHALSMNYAGAEAPAS